MTFFTLSTLVTYLVYWTTHTLSLSLSLSLSHSSSYDDLLMEKEELEEAVESLQTQLAAVDRGGGGGGGGGGGQDKKQLKMLHEVIRNLEVHIHTLYV